MVWGWIDLAVEIEAERMRMYLQLNSRNVGGEYRMSLCGRDWMVMYARVYFLAMDCHAVE